MREVCEVCEFYVDQNNEPKSNIIYRKNIDGTEVINSPSSYLIDYLEGQGIDIKNKDFQNLKIDLPFQTNSSENVNINQNIQEQINTENVNSNQVNPNTSLNSNQFVANINNQSIDNNEIEEFL